MQSSKEMQREIRKPSSVINEKKQRKTTEWERLDLFKKIRDTKGTFHAKMGSIKERNGMDLTEAEDIKKIKFIIRLLLRIFVKVILIKKQKLAVVKKQLIFLEKVKS